MPLPSIHRCREPRRLAGPPALDGLHAHLPVRARRHGPPVHVLHVGQHVEEAMRNGTLHIQRSTQRLHQPDHRHDLVLRPMQGIRSNLLSFGFVLAFHEREPPGNICHRGRYLRGSRWPPRRRGCALRSGEDQLPACLAELLGLLFEQAFHTPFRHEVLQSLLYRTDTGEVAVVQLRPVLLEPPPGGIGRQDKTAAGLYPAAALLPHLSDHDGVFRMAAVEISNSLQQSARVDNQEVINS
mmetsp:Transcript_20446/g.51876  ORF Transcript_20446/g.51876 Transcript_20446/m.51876 type:complete len:240 (+) Transcript_20446:1393-2112(+)